MKLRIICITFFIYSTSFAFDTKLHEFYNNHWKVTKRTIEYIENGEIIVDAQVESMMPNQSFKMNVAAMHPKSCHRILKKLSIFENYEKWISFIKSSKYNDKRRLWTIRADHALLPYPMIVHILVDRPTKTGTYEFTFPTGMFTGLKGHFIIKKHKNKCAFFAKSNWVGKDTKIADFIIELFSETLTKIGGEIIFRKIK